MDDNGGIPSSKDGNQFIFKSVRYRAVRSGDVAGESLDIELTDAVAEFNIFEDLNKPYNHISFCNQPFYKFNGFCRT